MNFHDCLVTYPEQAERVQQMMIAALKSMGVRPTIKVTAFDSSSRMPAEAILALGWT